MLFAIQGDWQLPDGPGWARVKVSGGPPDVDSCQTTQWPISAFAYSWMHKKTRSLLLWAAVIA